MARFAIDSSRAEELVGPFDRQERIAWWNQESLRSARILVAGAGAIGNEVIKNLTLMGVGYLLIVDFDAIDTSNLSRTVLFRPGDVARRKAVVAAVRARELCLESSARIDAYDGDLVWDLGAGVYSRVDLILGCLDNVEARLAINKFCSLTHRPWIDAGIRELGCRLNVYTPPRGVCYQCNLNDSQLKTQNIRYSCDIVKRKHWSEETVPTTQIAAALIAALQTQEAVKIICKQPSLGGKRLYYQGITNDFDILDLPTNPNCPAHVSYTEVHQLDVTRQISVREFLELIKREMSVQERFVLDLRTDFNFVIGATCRGCGRLLRLLKPAFRLFDTDLLCDMCKLVPSETSGEASFDLLLDVSLESTDDEILSLTLEELGFPLIHIASIYTASGRQLYAEVSGDAPAIFPSVNV